MVQGHHAADRPVQPAARGGVLREDVVQRQAEEEAQEHDREVPAGAGERQEGPQQDPRRAEPDAEGREPVGGVAGTRGQNGQSIQHKHVQPGAEALADEVFISKLIRALTCSLCESRF